jgi:hypothetical protein
LRHPAHHRGAELDLAHDPRPDDLIEAAQNLPLQQPQMALPDCIFGFNDQP